METAWFAAATLTGTACLALSLMVVVSGHRRRLAEVALAGSALAALSALMVASSIGGITDGIGGGLAGIAALPVSALLAAPLLSPHRRWARRLVQHWSPASRVMLAATAAFALVLAGMEAPPPPALRLAAAVLGGAGWSALAMRQLRLARISRAMPARIAAGATTVLTVSSLAAMAARPGSPLAWFTLVADNVALGTAVAAMLVGYRTGRSVQGVLAPILAREPLAALELGLAPEIKAFVDALERKDPVTRDHVVRTSALAMRLAIRAGLEPATVRNVAVGGLLHDIGKLVIPGAIINKPGALSDAEYATIKSHTERGAELLSRAPSLAGAAPFVRGHHERYDGRGYPDGLAGDAIALPVALVSVSDAWDAMISTRQYREGMAREDVEAIVRRGSGTQWHPTAVELLLTEIARHGHADADELAAHLPRVGATAALHDCAHDEVTAGG
ncbi:MAG: HD-GYP domain-containing protein [Acidimicrobiia bacterium]